MAQADQHGSYQLRIAAGRAVADAPQLGVAEALDGARRLVRLSILAESASDGAGTFMDQFVQRIAKLFDPSARSLTGALKLAVETAHQELLAWNQQSVRNQRACYGLSCVLEREDGATLLAQAGPSVGLLAGGVGLANFRATELHTHLPPTFSEHADEVAAPIGGEAPLTLAFAAAPSGAGGWALLLTSNAATLLNAERRVALSRLPAAETLRLLYPALLNLRDAAALVVAIGGDPAEDSAAQPPNTPSADAEQPGDEAPAGDNAVEDAVGPDQVDVRPLDAGDDRSTDRPPSPVPEAPDRAMDRAVAWLARFELAPLGELEVAGWPTNPFVSRSVQRVQTLAASADAPQPPMRPTRTPIMKLGAVTPSMLENWREPSVTPPQIRGRETDSRRLAVRRAGALFAVMMIALAVAAAALLGPSLLQSERDDAFASRVELARNSLAASHLQADPASARLALAEALHEVETALEINPLATDALRLRDDIESAMSELDLVQPPGSLSLLSDLASYGPALALGTIRGGGEGVFVLDDAGGRVFQITAEGIASVIFQEGEPLGLQADLQAGRPISLTWQEGAAGDAALWILDSNARLYRWTPTGVLLAPIPQLARLGSIDAVAATARSIYLLDSAGGAIWRYAVEGASLSEPSRAVGRTDLLHAHELTATVDPGGSVAFIVASTDGRLQRFSADEELALAAGLNHSLISPASISLGAQSGLVYVVDRGEGRIIAVGADGDVVGQIQSAELSELRGAWIDETSGEITYVLPSRLHSGTLTPAR